MTSELLVVDATLDFKSADTFADCTANVLPFQGRESVVAPITDWRRDAAAKLSRRVGHEGPAIAARESSGVLR